MVRLDQERGVRGKAPRGQKVRPEKERIANFRWFDKLLAGSSLPFSKESILAMHKAGIHTVISFLEPHEEIMPHAEKLEVARKLGINLISIPIPNMGPPTTAQFKKFLRIMRAADKTNRKVLVHCLMGVGRTGAMAAGYLIAERGLPLPDAFRIIRTGMQKAHYDALLADPKTHAKLMKGPHSLKDVLKQMPLKFPESLEQEEFLEKTEKNYRRARLSRQQLRALYLRQHKRPTRRGKRR